MLTANEVARFGEVIRQWQASRQLSHRQNSLWDRGWILSVALAALGTEWFLRRKEGLL